MVHSQGGVRRGGLALGYYRRLPPGVKSFIFERYSPLRVRQLRMTDFCGANVRLGTLSVGVIAVNDELGISAAAEFVEVHADALSVDVDAEWDDAIEHFEEQIDERQEQAQDGCNANQLCDELAWLRREEACGDESNERAGGVDRDCS